MADVLHTFSPNTKILSSEVNDNFETIQDELSSLSTNLETYVAQQNTTLKEELTQDLETVSTNLTNSKANIALDNVSPCSGFIQASTHWAMPNYSSMIGQASGVTYTASSDGFVWFSQRMDNGSGYVYINGISFWTVLENGSSDIVQSTMFAVGKGTTYCVTNAVFLYFIPCI